MFHVLVKQNSGIRGVTELLMMLVMRVRLYQVIRKAFPGVIALLELPGELHNSPSLCQREAGNKRFYPLVLHLVCSARARW